MRKTLYALIALCVVAAALSAGEANRVYILGDFSVNPLKLKCDTTQAINDTIYTGTIVTGVPLGRLYQFILQIDSTKSQSSATGKKASDSTWYRVKVQSRFGEMPNFFWNDICSLTTGSTGADTGTFIMEKFMNLAADTATDVNRIGDQFRYVITITDSMTSPVGTDTCKVDRVYGSAQMTVRH